ncbi:hypothetical protein [Pseudarthrobacter sp. PS3-L1]|uniref:hypothetical protein n=1 Tax=Pseudarthrobacter sp. PS3-L1 TaxID=3046207 RepID=UPI0024BA3B9A|nr:hypothetical protein [Pseudarthrobacter sp. PS3-L1]MDJ0321429.1 hypothetical protein [Pseudarthrobacter sp. PS3-L1]
MLSLTIVTLVVAAAGLIVWASDQRHGSYGVVLPAGAGVVVSTLAWIIAMSFGADYRPGLTWLLWIVPMVAGVAAALASALVLGRQRSKTDTAQLTSILRRA